MLKGHKFILTNSHLFRHQLVNSQDGYRPYKFYMCANCKYELVSNTNKKITENQIRETCADVKFKTLLK